MTPNHSLTLMLLRTEHKWYIQSEDPHSSLLQIRISYHCQRAVNIDMGF